ncbi:hypothetical protein QBC38DRAFT_457058 [Podospora fimiseda]|uniref:Uncharacterized protein n=1 Tax=Podospora fimiseda TaxID=252190 RepID=A0AAN7GVB3_9PEZI|nr:hypothetical protein QBC38DRAFT_457058 [Podospora fimiseda]
MGLEIRLGDNFSNYRRFKDQTIDGVVGTGISIRGFLPIDSQSTRESLLGFEGKATLLDTQAVGLLPEISDLQVHFSVQKVFANQNQFMWITGKVQTKKTTAGHPDPWAQTSGAREDRTNPDWATTMCRLSNFTDLGLCSSLYPYNFDCLFPTHTYLVINVTVDIHDWINYHNTERFLTSMAPEESRTTLREWNTTSIRNQLGTFKIHGASTKPWAKVRDRPVPPTEEVAEAYGQVRYYADLNKDSKSDLASMDSYLSAHMTRTCVFQDFGEDEGPAQKGAWTLSLRPTCTGFTANITGKLSADVFQDTFKETGSVASALQALVTAIFSTTFYEMLPH